MAGGTQSRKSVGFSRRELLSVGAVVPVALASSVVAAKSASRSKKASHPVSPLELEGLETLNTAEMEALDAVCTRIIPSDEHGAGATEARVTHYIDRALAGALIAHRPTYAAGLSALDAYARSTKARLFAQLEPTDQDAVLHDVEGGKVAGFPHGSAAFFNLVRTHTIEGMFCDPYYGGNANFVGWDLVGYPGLRMMVGAEDQRFIKPKALRRSAYSSDMFGRESAG